MGQRNQTVELSYHEVYMAACVGVAREVASLRRSQTNKVQNKDFGSHIDIESACGEVVVAKYLNLFWDGSVNTFKDPDVGKFQVRHTQRGDGSLILRKGDDPKSLYILVTGQSPIFQIRGFCTGAFGMQDEYVRDPNGKYPAWFVPQRVLAWIGELKAKIRAG